MKRISKSIIKPISETELTQQYQSVDKGGNDMEQQMMKLSKNSRTESKLSQLMRPLYTQPMLYFIMLMSIQTSMMREFFNMFGALYLQSVGANSAYAAFISGLFPLFGALSSVINGLYLDKMLKKENKKVGRYLLFPIQSILCTIAFVIFYIYNINIELYIAIILILISGFGILGMYAMMYVLSMDLGGQTSPTIVAGIADCFGLSGSMVISFLSGYGGYQFLYGILTIVAISNLFTTISLLFYVKIYKSTNNTA